MVGEPDQAVILVVEDAMVPRLALTRGVEHEGHRVLQASDGAEALDALDMRLPELDEDEQRDGADPNRSRAERLEGRDGREAEPEQRERRDEDAGGEADDRAQLLRLAVPGDVHRRVVLVQHLGAHLREPVDRVVHA